MKRGIDIIIASCLLILLLSILLVTTAIAWVAIGSPVIFWQRRVGRLEARIFVFKFRTMAGNSIETVIAASNPTACLGSGHFCVARTSMNFRNSSNTSRRYVADWATPFAADWSTC